MTVLHGAHANDGEKTLFLIPIAAGKGFLLLHQPGKRLALGSDGVQQRDVIGKFDGQAGQFAVVDGMRLGGEDSLGFLFGGTTQKSAMGGGDMLGDVGKHVFAALDIFVEKIRRKLRVKNTRGADGEKDEK